MKIKNFCTVCPSDGVQLREMLDDDGTKCHGCGTVARSYYDCPDCGAPLLWKSGGEWLTDAEPPHAEVVCRNCGLSTWRNREGGAK